MPTLPLFHAPATPDAWHQVQAPGGYEQWYFDAEDASGEIRIVAILGQRCTGKEHVRQYARYRRRPTKHRPPLPADWSCARFGVYRGQRELGQFTKAFRAGDFKASAESVEVTVGPNQLTGSDQGLRLVVSDSW